MEIDTKSLLLLSCCAPCSAGVIKNLAEQNIKFSVLFYNPNIAPDEEYNKRKQAQESICAYYKIPFIEIKPNHKEWLELVSKGLEKEKERGARCAKCFAMRLKTTAKFAKDNNFKEFSSVLGLSRYKDLEQVNKIAKEVAENQKIPYNFTNWRKGGAEQLGLKLCKEFNLYLQNYCGCEFSHR